MYRLTRWSIPISVVVVVFGLGLVHATYVGHYSFTGLARYGWYSAYSALLVIGAFAVGLPDVEPGGSPLWHAIGAVVIGAGGMSVIQLGVATPVLPRFVVLFAGLSLVLVFTAINRLSERLLHHLAARDRVLAIVDGDPARSRLCQEVGQVPERALTLVATSTRAELEAAGTPRPLLDLAHRSDATVVVLDRAAQESPEIIAQASALHAEGLRIRTLSLFYDQWLGKLPVNELERISLLFDINELHSVRYVRVKRLVDAILAVAGLAALAVAVPIVWTANLAGNRGPLLYRQERVGKHGATFTIVKFRTMTPNAGSDGERVDSAGRDGEGPGDGLGGGAWTQPGDARLTPVGRVLRRVHLDELPQVVNVLRGELTVVGPRPEQPRYVAELEKTVPFYNVRHLVLPGMTGWAQVKYSYGASALDALEKLQYDFYYLRHQSLALDMKILGRTVSAVLHRSGR